MHEFSVMRFVAEAVLEAARSRGAERVVEVRLGVGELAFLNPEQLDFAWSVLSKVPLLEGSTLTIEGISPLVRCPVCGYEGDLRLNDDPVYHAALPIFACPRCSGPVEVVRGRECEVLSVRLEVSDPA